MRHRDVFEKEKTMSECLVYSMCNHKGGIGKSTAAVTMVAFEAMLGKRVLLIDNDPQANSSKCSLETLGGVDISDIFQSINDFENTVKSAVKKSPFGYDVISSSDRHRTTIAYLLTQTTKRPVQKILAKAIRILKDNYDVIFIDNPPELSMLVNNALMASDFVFIPVNADGYSYQGLSAVVDTIYDIMNDEDMNPKLRIAGIFINKAETRTSVFKQYDEYYRDSMDTAFCKTPIRLDSTLALTASYFEPLPFLLTDPSYKAASKWKTPYDFTYLMREANVINETEFKVLLTSFMILEGKWVFSITNSDIASISLVAKKGETKVDGRDFCIDMATQADVCQALVAINRVCRPDKKLRMFFDGKEYYVTMEDLSAICPSINEGSEV
jgi:chromosome partitioning protein